MGILGRLFRKRETVVRVKVIRQECALCGGFGRFDDIECPRCNGTGYVTVFVPKSTIAESEHLDSFNS
jgi:DnaJ-class molecular chaperone